MAIPTNAISVRFNHKQITGTFPKGGGSSNHYYTSVCCLLCPPEHLVITRAPVGSVPYYSSIIVYFYQLVFEDYTVSGCCSCNYIVSIFCFPDRESVVHVVQPISFGPLVRTSAIHLKKIYVSSASSPAPRCTSNDKSSITSFPNGIAVIISTSPISLCPQSVAIFIRPY